MTLRCFSSNLPRESYSAISKNCFPLLVKTPPTCFTGVGRSVHGTAGTAGRPSGLHPQRPQPRADLRLYRHRPCTAFVDPQSARPGDKWPFVQFSRVRDLRGCGVYSTGIPHASSVRHHRIDASSPRLFIVRFRFVYLSWLVFDRIADEFHGVPYFPQKVYSVNIDCTLDFVR